MKRIIFLAIISLAALSCSLNESYDGFVGRKQAYQTKQQAQAVVNRCYTYTNFITTNFGLMVEACTDLWNCSTSTVDASVNINPNNPGQGTSIWTNCYKGVMTCNEAIECIIASATIPDEDKYPLQAEARALRALYYYFLTNTFNGVPFYLYMVEDRDTQDKVQALPRTDAKIIRRTLYQDLKENALPYFTEENGLKTRPSEIKGNRAGYALSLMLMAKFAMWTEDWKDAMFALDKLESLYGELSSYPLEETSWNLKNTPESIFEIQHAWSPDGVQYSSSYGRMLLPAYSGDGVFDGIYMPELGENISSWAPLRTNDRFIKAADAKTSTAIFSNPPLIKSSIDGLLYLDCNAAETGIVRGEKLDKRILMIIGLGKLSTGETFKAIKSQGNAYAGPKFWCEGMVSSYDSNNYKILRFADAMLMMAECHAELNGNLSEATRYLNMTRTRAGLDPLPTFGDKIDFLKELRDERARELAGELHRKYDLVRWGIWYDETYSNTEYSTLKNNIRPCHKYYPIPDTECALSNYILTNDEYKAVE